MHGDILRLVLAHSPRGADEVVRQVCRDWQTEVKGFRAQWLARGAWNTVHPNVSYRVLAGMPLRAACPASPVFRPTSPEYSPTSPAV